MDKASMLIDLIDNELVILQEASYKKGQYSHFNFKQALLSLNDEFLKLGLFENNTVPNSYYKNKIKDYINVFNDLCNFQAETINIRYLSCDKDSKEFDVEQITYDQITRKHTTEIKKVKCNNDDFEFLSNSEFPAKEYTAVPWTCKFDYLLRDCNVNYDRIGTLNRKNEKDDFHFLMDNLELYNKVLKKEDNFDSYFGLRFSIQISTAWDYRYKFSFEEYVKTLKDKRIIDMSLQNENQRENDHDKDDIKQIETVVKILVPKFISIDQRDDFKEFLINGRVKNKTINIKGKYSEFHAVLFPYKYLIPTKFTSSWYDLIANNFTRNGNPIPKTTISNSLNND